MTDTSSANPVPTRALIRWGISGFLYKLFVAAVLMLSAGRWDWIAGWVYAGIFLLFDVATAIVVIPRSPGLLVERSNRHAGIKSWDKAIMPLAAGVLPMISWIVAGLDQRFHWLPDASLNLQIAAALITACGYGIVVWAMGANAYFSTVVRIQTERGHQVASGGPYAIIRHPGYAGALLFTLAAPVLLGSGWALIPAGLAAVLLGIRTHLEDATLQAELPGYRDYAAKVRYRLFPGVW